MQLKIIMIILAITSIISLSACSQSNPVSFEISYEDLMNEQHFTWAVNAEVGQTIMVTLGSNPTTGFIWPDTAQISNQEVVKQTDHQYISPQENTGVGVSGEDVWTFKATEKGATMISMNYSQPWDGGDLREWTFTAFVSVK